MEKGNVITYKKYMRNKRNVKENGEKMVKKHLQKLKTKQTGKKEEDDMEKYIQKICIALILKNRLQSTCSASMMLEKVIMLGESQQGGLEWK